MELDQQVHVLQQFVDQSVQGTGTGMAPLTILCDQAIDRLHEDADAVVCLGATPYESDFPTRHGLHTSRIAMAIGLEMGLGREQLMDLGMGCMIHDLGMHKTGVSQFETKGKITDRHRRLLADHPVHSVEIAGQYGDEISERAQMVAYQIHERIDGSGYPRGFGRDQIHSLAKIAGVAETFVDLLAPRPNRVGFQGYYVVAHLLDQMKAGKFEPPVIRALLQATSLYPIGSCVELSNGKVGRVIRTGAQQFDRPTVEIWDRRDLESNPDIINLRVDTGVSITAPIPSMQAAPQHQKA
ncbi:MAG: HD domain-containing protein [Pirellulaceae bacterium]|nr:HD domain-containing protein [Pirellulaceae bacterium]